MNEALYHTHFETVLEICQSQISSIGPLVSAACNSMLDIIKASLKYGAPVGHLIGPMLVSLAGTASGEPTAVVALRTIIFDIALPVPNLIEICQILLASSEDWEGEIRDQTPFLLIRLIRMAAETIPADAVQFAMEAHAGLSAEPSPLQEFHLLFAMSCCVLFLPTAFPLEFKRAALLRFVEKVAAGQTDVYAVYLLGQLAIPSLDDVSFLWEPILRLFMEIAGDDKGFPMIRDYAVLGLMNFAMRLVTPENASSFQAAFTVIFSRLPFAKTVAIGGDVMWRFMVWVRDRTSAFNRDLIRVGIAWFMEGIELAQLAPLRDLLQGLLAGIANYREVIAELCGGDELAIQNLQDLLDPEE
jgi:hypothetical protein